MKLQSIWSALLMIPLFVVNFKSHAQVSGKRQMTLDELINILSLEFTSSRIANLNYRNELLMFENYKKGLLPSLSFNVNPINLNRSLKLLQNPDDGSYSYVEFAE